MQLRQLGEHGLMVSALGLGTRAWGQDIDQHEAKDILTTYLDAGGTFVQVDDDTVDHSATVLGEALPSSQRDAVTIAVRTGGGPVGRGRLLDSLDFNLRELKTDRADLWIVAGPRGSTPLAEILSALEVAYRSGRARYVGVSNLSWWDGGAAVATAQQQGWGLQAWGAPVSLLHAELLQPEAAQLRASGLGVIAGSPLAGGVLTGKYRRATPADSRAASPRFRQEIETNLANSRGVTEALVRAGEGLDMTPGQVALLWCLGVPTVTTAVVGPRTKRQLELLVDASGQALPQALMDVLTELATSQ